MRNPLWPSAREYVRAIDDPLSLSDPKLQRGTIERTLDGEPRGYAGTFATTFHIATTQGDVAFRCFTRGHDDSIRRYRAIGEFLRYTRVDALCETHFELEAIAVRGALLPAVVMEWVAGEPLNAVVARRFEDGDALRSLANDFREVVRSLGALGIAHGDLQHGNLLVSPRGMRVIDYDAMFLPPIADLAQVEFGHRNYQHPARRDAAFDGRLDRFSALVIYTALVALSADRSLWPRFDDGENVLFRAHDFASAGESDLMRALLHNNAASGLAEIVIAAARGPVDAVPALEEAIAMSAGTTARYIPIPPPRRTMAPDSMGPTVVAPPVPPRVDVSKATPHDRSRRSVASFAPFALVLLIFGFAIGAGAAVFNHRSTTPIAREHASAIAMRGRAMPPSVAPHTPRPIVLASAPATMSQTIAPTIVPTFVPTIAPRATVAPVTAHSARPNVEGLSGTWDVAESNRLVGTIVWSGRLTRVSRDAVELDVRKASVAGQIATPCERATMLHASFISGVTNQVVPFRETNCRGASSGGEIHIARFAPDASSFAGSVWQDGAKLGDFAATKR